jgi:uncharacterized metal-binding protein YceD (DUF177 family)
MTPSAPYPLSRPQAVDSLPAKGVEVTVEANEAERAALAEVLDILGIDRLVANFTVTPWRKGGAKVRGVVEADVIQACVVTLEPVSQKVREDVDLSFVPEDELPPPRPEVEVEPDAPDLPEAIENGKVDLGAIAAEHMALGLDPYPRAPGAEFEGYMEDDGSNDGPESPFARLAALKRDETD